MIPTERRQRITDVFELAVKLRPEERDGFIERECGGDDALLQDVKSLLSEYRLIGETEGVAPPPIESEPSPAPQRIGKYQIEQEIGSGGFGHVYRALDPAFDRVVAIKVLNTPDNLDIVRRFRAEARTVAKLHHKNIVTVHDFGEEGGVPYLVMEYLDGTTLEALIHRNSLSLLEKVEIMSEVAEGLQYAHERGVTHRDVKPANIMRLTDGSVKIMDFGIARMAVQTSTRLTQTGSVIGSLMYMAPEQFSGTSDALTDVFGYGVTFHELLTGQNPFSSPDPAIIIFRITNTDPPAVRSLVPECPEALDRILRGALARSREARYASLSDVIADTRAILSDLRRDQADKLYAEAGQLLAAGQLDAAKPAVRKALDLDPGHAGARRLRSEVEEALHQRDLAVRARSLMDNAELGLRERRFEEAAGILDSVRQLNLGDPQLKARLDMAAAQIEQARRCEKLLEAARGDLKNQNLTEAFRAASEGLSADPGNNAGRNLLQEIRSQLTAREARRRLQEELSRAEGLLLIGETDQALSLLTEIDSRNPESAEASTLRVRAEAQKAQEDRARRLTEGTAEVRTLLRNGQLDRASARLDSLLSEFAGNPEIQTLRSYLSERLAAQRRLEQIARVKSEAARLSEKDDFDQAIRALEAGIAALGDDGDLTRMLQAALAGKASQERERAVADASREAESLLQQGNGSAALVVLRQVTERYGDDTELQRLRDLAESQVRDRERAARLKLIGEEIRKLAAAMQWEEALQKVDEALGAFPGEPSLISERESLIASRNAAQREQAIRSLLTQIQSLRIGARFAEAMQVVEKGLRDLGQDARLLEAQQHLAESLAEQQRAEYIGQVCREARALQNQGRFDEAILVLEACENRYPGVPAVADLLLTVKNDRKRYLDQQEMDQALARAAAAIEAGEAEKAIGSLEEAVKSHPESRDPVEATADLQASAPPATPSTEEGLPGAPPPKPHDTVRRFRTLWIAGIAGGVLAAFGILYWATHLHSKPSAQATNILSVEQPTGPDTVTLGQAFSKTLRASGGSVPISWAIGQGSLPEGLTLDSTTGRIAGTPTKPGAFPFLAKASDSAGHRAERAMTITVIEPALSPSPKAGDVKVNPKDGLQYDWIPPGTFQMGCSPGDNECSDGEKPDHQVTISSGFWMGQTEVTQEAYQRVMGTNPSHFKGPALPVEEIGWNDARGYCQAAGMRLPTEAEWEYAARAGSSGSRYGDLDGIAWHSGNSGGKTHEVAGRQANSWGLHDMLGNVWEWVEDWYDQYPPGNATDPQGPASGTLRVLRGGAWYYRPRFARASHRNRGGPTVHDGIIGFRCAGSLTILVGEPPVVPPQEATPPKGPDVVPENPPAEDGTKPRNPSEPVRSPSNAPTCTSSVFVLEQYGDSRAGELVWTGRLQAGRRIEIENRHASSGSVQGDTLPRGVPVRVSVSPETIRLTSAPSAANCWASRLVLRSVGAEASEIRIKWEVFQP